MFQDQVFDFEKRFAHRDAQRFNFGGTRDNAAVVIWQDDDGNVTQVGAENALTTGIEIVTIAEGKQNKKNQRI